MSWVKLKIYFKPLFFGLFHEPSFICFIFFHDNLESVEFLLFSFSHLSFFKSDLFLDFFDKELIKLIFIFLIHFLSFIFIFDLSVSHFLFKINFSLVFFFLFSFPFIVKFGLLLLELEILWTLFFLTFFLSSFFFHLLVKFFFYLFLELLLSHFFQLFFFLKKFCIEFHKCGPFIIVITFNLVNWFGGHRTCFRAVLGTGALAFCFLFLLISLRWCLAALFKIVPLIELLFGCLGFGFFGGRLFWIKKKHYSFGIVFCSHQQPWRHPVWGIWGILRWFFSG